MSAAVLLPGEDPQALEDLAAGFRQALGPQNGLEQFLTDRLISLAWRLVRAARTERHYLQVAYENHEDAAVECSPARRKAYIWHELVDDELAAPPGCRPPSWPNLLRYETTIERQFYKALHELLRLQAGRRGESPPLPIALELDVSTEATAPDQQASS